MLIEFITFLVVMYMNEKQGKELDEGLFIIGIITLTPDRFGRVGIPAPTIATV